VPTIPNQYPDHSFLHLDIDLYWSSSLWQPNGKRQLTLNCSYINEKLVLLHIEAFLIYSWPGQASDAHHLNMAMSNICWTRTLKSRKDFSWRQQSQEENPCSQILATRSFLRQCTIVLTIATLPPQGNAIRLKVWLQRQSLQAGPGPCQRPLHLVWGECVDWPIAHNDSQSTPGCAFLCTNVPLVALSCVCMFPLMPLNPVSMTS